MIQKITKKYHWIAAGLTFAILWASASTATKIGLNAAQPLSIAIVRFGVAALIMLAYSHLIRGNRLPEGKEWKQIAIYGLLNISIYLGCYVIAMQKVTAGIGALAVATNPVFISFISVFFLNKKLTLNVIIALCICSAGVVCAAWPWFNNTTVTTEGLMILLFSMLSYSLAAIYFSSSNWNNLDLFTINGWQTLIGGILLLPVACFYYNGSNNHFNLTFWGAVLWLAIPVSIFAVQLWLWLLKTNTIKAGMWLFLCPIFGFSIAALIMKDTISTYTIVGVLLVMIGLVLSQKTQKDHLESK
ncbi:DMT family transporter [Solitalea koreensis]|uniref:Permease of the drug/metabolite transporter (DMT) superfamily n=1 Tax=Solitalea koreensis TaxID=543615 RepID=A0A521D259_9SPHI|nr:DMT family transporter [Solitalea koreensis]SMO65764.1 Permease of the drug/metabolite transporter (DMT) superfamily [Solitalea koreensis]